MAPGLDSWSASATSESPSFATSAASDLVLVNDAAGWKADEGGASVRGWQPDDAGNEGGFGGDFAPENISKHADGDYNAPADGGCRICHEDGHFARDCPSRSNACYNCGEEGHNKADCPNPRVEHEFTGECRICQIVGHRAADCPSKPAQPCKICAAIDHLAAECTANRMMTDFANLGITDVELEEAWKMVVKADAEKDVTEIKKAILTYARAYPALTWLELETVFRESGMKTYLIAKKQEVSDTHTIVNLQGDIDQKYVVSFQFSATPRRAKFAEGWPPSAEKNLARLPEAGLPLDRMVPKCDNCGQMGHGSKKCPEEKVEKPKLEMNCVICGSNAHYARDCKEPRKSGKECRICSGDHMARDCPNKEVKRCKNCDEEDHIAKDCPHPKDMDKVQCRNCDEFGHTGRDCPKPTDWSRVEGKNCGEKGHTIKRCKQPVPESDNGFDENNGGGGGGWSDAVAENEDTSANAGDAGWVDAASSASAW